MWWKLNWRTILKNGWRPVNFRCCFRATLKILRANAGFAAFAVSYNLLRSYDFLWICLAKILYLTRGSFLMNCHRKFLPCTNTLSSTDSWSSAPLRTVTYTVIKLLLCFAPGVWSGWETDIPDYFLVCYCIATLQWSVLVRQVVYWYLRIGFTQAAVLIATPDVLDKVLLELLILDDVRNFAYCPVVRTTDIYS